MKLLLGNAGSIDLLSAIQSFAPNIPGSTITNEQNVKILSLLKAGLHWFVIRLRNMVFMSKISIIWMKLASRWVSYQQQKLSVAQKQEVAVQKLCNLGIVNG